MSAVAEPARWRTILRVLALRDDAFWSRSWRHWVARKALFCLYLYVGVLIVLLALENRFLFGPTTAAESWEPPPAGLVVEDVELPGADGALLHAWWSAPPGWHPGKGALLYCHGNAGNLSHRGEAVRGWQHHTGRGVLIFDYPGYGRSTGRPSEQACYAATHAAYDWLVQQKGVRPVDLVVYGNSLGAAMATELASGKTCRALVLSSPFSSFPDMAQKTFPWLPARWLVRTQMDNVARIGKVKAPVFIAHGTADELVPFAQGQKVFAAAAEPKRFLALEGHGHNSPRGPVFYEGVLQFLKETAPAE